MPRKTGTSPAPRAAELFFDTWAAGPSSYVEHPARAVQNLSFGGGLGASADANAANALRWTMARRPADLAALRERGKEQLELYARSQKGSLAPDRDQFSRDEKWLAHVAKSGTTSDQLAARVLQVQEDPLANLSAMDALLSLAQKKSRTVAEQAIAALRELFLSSLLPDDRPLLAFSDQCFDVSDVSALTNAELAYAFFEETLKEKYLAFLTVLQTLTMDTVTHIKKTCVRCAYLLLVSKPENERLLLDIIINKLGDAHDHVVASDASFVLGKLAQKHPAMRPYLAGEVSHFMLTKVRQLPLKSLHYGCTFLNQLPLTREEQEATAPKLSGLKVTSAKGTEQSLAARLMKTYFTLFDVVLARDDAAKSGLAIKTTKTKGSKTRRHNHPKQLAKRAVEEAAEKAANEHHLQDGEAGQAIDSKVVGALLAGIKRAFPYCRYADNRELYDSHLDSLFRLVHTTVYAKAVQTLQVLYQIATAAETELRKSRRKQRGKSAASDEPEAGDADAPEHPRQSLFDRFMNSLYAKLAVGQTPELRLVSKRHTHLLNLTFSAMCQDVETTQTPSASDVEAHTRAETRLHAFIRRLVQLACFGEANVSAGVLFLISQVIQKHPGLQSAVSQPEPILAQEEEEDEDDDGDDEEAEGKEAGKGEGTTTPGASRTPASKSQRYDPTKRNPAFSDAGSSCSWDIVALLHHWHPSVAMFASHVLDGTPIEYKSDPMLDFTLGAFLERFVYKNPKQTGSGTPHAAPGQVMSGNQLKIQAARAKGDAVRTRIFGRKGIERQAFEDPVNSATFAQLPLSRVPVDEVFFHKFHAPVAAERRQSQSQKQKQQRGGEDTSKNDMSDIVHDGDGGDSDDDASSSSSSSSFSEAEAEADLGGAEIELSDFDDDGDGSDSDEYSYGDMEAALADDSSDEEVQPSGNEWGVLDARGKFDKAAAERQLLKELSDDWDDVGEGDDSSSGDDDDDDIGAAFSAKAPTNSSGGGGGGSAGKASAFVDASEFAEQLAHAGDEFHGEKKKQIAWELKSRGGAQAAKNKKQKDAHTSASSSSSSRGGGGSRGGGSRGGGNSRDSAGKRDRKRPAAPRGNGGSGGPPRSKRGRRA
jgi:ribosome biogenesis protein MAK21